MIRRAYAYAWTAGLLVLAACAMTTGHENFIYTMQGYVGRYATDPNVPFNRYSENRGPVNETQNVRLEQQYNFAPNCRVIFEIDKATQKIIAWRYEGTKDACRIPL